MQKPQKSLLKYNKDNRLTKEIPISVYNISRDELQEVVGQLHITVSFGLTLLATDVVVEQSIDHA